MKIAVEVTRADLDEMGLTPEELEGSVKQNLGTLDAANGEPIYCNDVAVTVIVND